MEVRADINRLRQSSFCTCCSRWISGPMSVVVEGSEPAPLPGPVVVEPAAHDLQHAVTVAHQAGQLPGCRVIRGEDALKVSE